VNFYLFAVSCPFFVRYLNEFIDSDMMKANLNVSVAKQLMYFDFFLTH
jgi:hypothetical protein